MNATELLQSLGLTVMTVKPGPTPEMAWTHMHEMMCELVGAPCPDFQPGCAVCDMWEAYDLHAYGAVRNELEDTIKWMRGDF